MRYVYQVYGKLISCDIPIPGWFPHEDTGETDISIKYSESQNHAHSHEKYQLLYTSIHLTKSGQPLFEFYKFTSGYVFTYPGIANYTLFVDSQEIWVNAYKDSIHAEVLYFLVKGPILTFWLTLNQTICLHASAVIVEDCAIGFLAPSLGGKSTLALSFLKNGYKLISDDVLSISMDFKNAGYFTQPSMPILKIRSNDELSYCESKLPIKCPGQKEHLVDILELFPSSWHEGKVTLGKLYFLDRQLTSTCSIKTISLVPNEILFKLIANTQGSMLFEKLDLFAPSIKCLADLAVAMPIEKLRYPSGLEYINEVIEFIIADLE